MNTRREGHSTPSDAIVPSSDAPVDVVFDISALGADPNHLQTRTGVSRVVENLANGLAASSECAVRFSATASFLTLGRVRAYLQEHQELATVPFLQPPSRAGSHSGVRLAERIARFTGPDLPLTSRIARRLLVSRLNMLERRHNRLDTATVPPDGVFHSPFFALPEPGRLPARMQRFLTVNDLIPILAPQFFGRGRHFLHGILASVRPDDWLIAISEATRQDLVQHLHCDHRRVFVTHLAASTDLFHHVSDPASLARVRQKYRLPEGPYVLSLNTLEPRKNVEHSVRCFVRAVEEARLDGLTFALAGPVGWDYGQILETVADARVRQRVQLIGYVDDGDLAALYSGALAFLFMSHYEGFGLPPLEAMQCGTPVITSNTSSLPEVVGDAGITLAPNDEDGLCQSIVDVYRDASLRQAMSSKSLDRARRFSWERCTSETLAAYKAGLAS